MNLKNYVHVVHVNQRVNCTNNGSRCLPLAWLTSHRRPCVAARFQDRVLGAAPGRRSLHPGVQWPGEGGVPLHPVLPQLVISRCWGGLLRDGRILFFLYWDIILNVSLWLVGEVGVNLTFSQDDWSKIRCSSWCFLNQLGQSDAEACGLRYGYG